MHLHDSPHTHRATLYCHSRDLMKLVDVAIDCTKSLRLAQHGVASLITCQAETPRQARAILFSRLLEDGLVHSAGNSEEKEFPPQQQPSAAAESTISKGPLSLAVQAMFLILEEQSVLVCEVYITLNVSQYLAILYFVSNQSYQLTKVKMPIALPDLATVLDEATLDFAKLNPKSKIINESSNVSLPGGTTRNVIYMKPFPVVMTGGDGSYLTDVDGHKYLDLCGEYSACMFGHSYPAIKKAMHDAIDQGYGLGALNKYEGKLASLFCRRFKTMDKIRFSNSGTEANMTALALVKAYTGKSKIIVFEGGYHGGLAAFATESENNMKSSGKKTMNAPHDWVVVPYNNVAALETAVHEHKADLACILVELMQGSSGCIPADIPFIKACRALATEAGAVLFFDEVMTSRMSVHGYQDVIGVYPDMTSLGKYFAGGGQNFGAFGGKSEIMSLLEPGYPGGVYHSGTFNNNITTMATATAVLEQVWTESEATDLFDKGVWLREELNKLSEKHKSSMHVSGTGSLMTIHFTGKEIKCAADAHSGNSVLKELFFFDMLKKGFWLARRGMISLMTVTTRQELRMFLDAVDEFLRERAEFVGMN
ncbi:uncharacterized protein Z518_02082 [Rhinocladiella mackenziei CBS 650.93]|uniref:Glutamate-1-semialdehyde 2,1-aminomutase n=1 Tax=Rhinocladiella mackenziei CBS 650.93 TaxID=1442369 RepID=A0A0D2INP7_9EURO|nr:uncharacterized protein Z518_02082 [Rhinocladiella mackenziei CBS 650.93]KIX07429.1 hypothetical protein Z518_02082 [Rhinocladiella mackenziei CBS 650.93]